MRPQKPLVGNQNKGILKARKNNSKLEDNLNWVNNNKIKTDFQQRNKEEYQNLKIFTGTSKSIKYYSKKFQERSRNVSLLQVGSHLYEIIGMVDSRKTYLDQL